MLDNKTIFTEDAIIFAKLLLEKFSDKRLELLKLRDDNHKKFDRGEIPNFLENTQSIRNSNWKISDIPNNLQKRTIEITGPPYAKMMINAFNSKVDCYMCDIEDSLSPTWNNIVNAQLNLYKYTRNNLVFFDKKKNKTYKIINKNPPV